MFTFSISNPPDVASNFVVQELLAAQYFNAEKTTKQKVRVIVDKVRAHWRINIEFLLLGNKNLSKYMCRFPMGQFKFGVEASTNSFFFLGCSSFAPRMDIEGMLNGMRTDQKIMGNERPNYAQGISLLRLRDNVVVMVEEENVIDMEEFEGGR